MEREKLRKEKEPNFFSDRKFMTAYVIILFIVLGICALLVQLEFQGII